MTVRAAPVVLAAPTGTGKTTLAHRLVADSPDFVFSVSATTRTPRVHEVDGVDYHFLTRDLFEKRIAADDFVEWAEVHGRLYGTPRFEIDRAATRGQHIVLDIDVQGARQIAASVPDAKLIFVLPPSVDIMMARLDRRGTEGPDEVARRLRSALQELQAVPDFDYVVINDDLDECLHDIRAIVAGNAGPESKSTKDVESFRAEIGRLLDETYGEHRSVPD